MAKVNSIDNKAQELTIDEGSSGKSRIQFDINTSNKYVLGTPDGSVDRFYISTGGSLGSSNAMTSEPTGETRFGLQPAFSAYNSADDNDVTGDSTAYQIICNTEIFDQGSDYNSSTGVFTAPTTGRYVLFFSIKIHDISGHTGSSCSIVTSNRTYLINNCDPDTCDISGSLAGFGHQGLIIADMDASDTAYVQLTVSGGTKTIDVEGGGDMVTRFCGYLAV